MKQYLLAAIVVLTFWCTAVIASDVSKVVVGSGNWTEPLSVEKGASVNVSIGDINATSSHTIILQRKLPGDSSWGREVHTWDITGASDPIEEITEPEAEDQVFYRLGCDTTFSSGNSTVRLGGGRK